MLDGSFVYPFFALFVVACSSMVVTAKSPVVALVFLVMDLIALSGIYAMLAAHFVAAIQVILYAGAIVILFLFVVMVLQIGDEQGHPQLGGFLVKKSLFAVMAVVLLGSFGLFICSGNKPIFLVPQESLDNTKEVALLLYHRYPWPFELASCLILMAVIACIVISNKKASVKGC